MLLWWLDTGGRLLPIAITLDLFLHMLCHVSKHLKELIFVLLWRLDTGGRLLRQRGASAFCGMRLIDDRWGNYAPTVLMPFDVVSLRVRVCFIGANGVVEETF